MRLTAVRLPMQAQNADPSVTMTLPATDAAAALKELGNKVGRSLFPSPQTANATLAFRFENVPVSEAMKRIADVVDGTWKKEASGYRLVRTPDQRRDEESEEFSQRLAAITKSIQVRTEEYRKLPPWSVGEADSIAAAVQGLVNAIDPKSMKSGLAQQAMHLGPHTPIARAMSEMISVINPRELAGLSSHYKMVLSTRPTPIQRAFPAELMPAGIQFVANQADWAAAVQKHRLVNPPFQPVSYWNGDFGDFEKIADRKLAVMLLSASLSQSSGIQLELTAYDDKGLQIAQAEDNLGNETENLADVMKDASKRASEKLVALEGDSKALIDSRFPASKQDRPKLSPALIDQLSHPERRDPLSFFLSPPLEQAAEIKNLNMVACLSDSAFYGGAPLTGQGTSVDNSLQRLAPFGIQARLNGGWLVVKPKRPIQTQSERADRKQLGQYLRRKMTGRPLSIEEQAAFAQSLTDSEPTVLPSFLLPFLRIHSDDSLDDDMLRLYGSLSSEQRARLGEGGLLISSLSDAQREFVNRMVYGPDSVLRYRPLPDPNGGLSPNEFESHLRGLLREPTEALPDGLPSRGLITIASDTSTIVIAQDRRSSRSFARAPELDAKALAWQRYVQDRPDLFPDFKGLASILDLSTLQLGKRLRLTFTFQFTPALSIVRTLEDKSVGEFVPISMDNLPNDFKHQIDGEYDTYKRHFANTKPGDLSPPTRGTNPPP